MTIARKCNLVVFRYSIEDALLKGCTTFRDLRIKLDSKLTSNDQILSTVNKVYKSFGFVVRYSKIF